MYNEAIKLLNYINKKGFVSYIVGGYPRDLYLKRDSSDIDICTSATPKDLKDIFGDIMLPKVNYGSVTIRKKGIRFEITTFRHEIKYKDNRLPIEIEYIDNLEDDLKRRDFTINTLCIDSKGNTIDLLNAKKDIDSKIIKTVGDSFDKIKEDSLRILRAVRFATQLNFKLDDELKEAIKKYGYLLKRLSYERKKEELNKIFMDKNVRYGLDLIKELHLDKYLELSNISYVVPIKEGIWAQLGVLNIYPFTKEEKEYIEIINKYIDEDFYNIDILYSCSQYGLGYIYTICSIKGLDFKEIEKMYMNLPIKNKKDIEIKPLEISGILNKLPGSYIKDIISDLEYNILHNNLQNSKEILTDYILKKYKNM